MSSAPNPYGAPTPWAAPANPDPWNGQYGAPQQALDPRIAHVMGETKFWLNILGWSFIAGGVFYCITIVGIIIGWLPIWMGLGLTKAAKAANNVQQTGSADEAVNYLTGVKTYFVIMGVMTLIGLVLAVGSVLFVLATGGLAAILAAAEQGR